MSQADFHQMQARTLQLENKQLRGQMQSMMNEMQRINSTDKLLASALSGAASRLEDPVKAAQFAIQATNALVNELANAVKEHEKPKEDDDGS